MKTNRSIQPQGGAHVVSLLIAVLIGSSLAGYHTLVANRNGTVTKSRLDDAAKPAAKVVAEPAGAADVANAVNALNSAPQSHAAVAGVVASPANAGRLKKEFPEVPPPRGPFTADPAGGSVNGFHYAHILGSGRYIVTGTLTGNLLVTGNAILYVPKNAKVGFGSEDVIRIAKGARLTLFNDSCTDAVFGRFVNNNHSAVTFLYFGLADTHGSEATFWMDRTFYGGLYAPRQNLVLIGDRDQHHDIYGSVIGHSVTTLLTADNYSSL